MGTVVMGGHWLATIVVVGDGQPRGRSALAEFGYMRWLTLLGRWAGWTHARFVRPT